LKNFNKEVWMKIDLNVTNIVLRAMTDKNLLTLARETDQWLHNKAALSQEGLNALSSQLDKLEEACDMTGQAERFKEAFRVTHESLVETLEKRKQVQKLILKLDPELNDKN
jgi:hypothetical protein